MKYKLRSSTKNAAESKSTYHSSSRSSTSGNTGGPPEKRARIEHGVGGRSGGTGVSLRRKPWFTSLISVETQTDVQVQTPKLDNVESQPTEDRDKRVQCIKICDLCGAGKMKRRRLKIADDIQIKETDTVAEISELKTSISNDIPPEDKDISSRVTILSASVEFNADTKLTIRSLPLEVSNSGRTPK